MHANQDAPVTGIVAVDLATGEERQVVTFTSADRSNDCGIAVSPDGNTLAVTAWTKATPPPGCSPSVRLVRALARWWARSPPAGSGISCAGPRMGVHSSSQCSIRARTGGYARCGGWGYTGVRRRQLRRDFVPAPVVKLWSGNFNNMDLSPDGSRIITSALTSAKWEIWTLDGLMTAINSR